METQAHTGNLQWHTQLFVRRLLALHLVGTGKFACVYWPWSHWKVYFACSKPARGAVECTCAPFFMLLLFESVLICTCYCSSHVCSAVNPVRMSLHGSRPCVEALGKGFRCL